MENGAHLLFCLNLVVTGSQRGAALPSSIWWHQNPLMKGFSGSTAQVLWQDSWGMLCGPHTQNATIHSLNQLLWERVWDSVSWVGVPSLGEDPFCPPAALLPWPMPLPSLSCCSFPPLPYYFCSKKQQKNIREKQFFFPVTKPPREHRAKFLM